MDACKNCAMMDVMVGNQGTKNALVSVSTTVFDESVSWALDVHYTKVCSLKNWLRYFRSFSIAATKLSCLAFASR